MCNSDCWNTELFNPYCNTKITLIVHLRSNTAYTTLQYFNMIPLLLLKYDVWVTFKTLWLQFPKELKEEKREQRKRLHVL